MTSFFDSVCLHDKAMKSCILSKPLLYTYDKFSTVFLLIIQLFPRKTKQKTKHKKITTIQNISNIQKSKQSRKSEGYFIKYYKQMTKVTKVPNNKWTIMINNGYTNQ